MILAMGNIQDTDLAAHLENIIKSIKMEDKEQVYHVQFNDSIDHGPEQMTGPCMEFILQARVMENLVGWAEMDVCYFDIKYSLIYRFHLVCDWLYYVHSGI